MNRFEEFVRLRGRVQIMAVLNRTPDSFSDGGRYRDAAAAMRRLEELVHHGSDIIDVGAESTRPGAARITVAEQKRRLGSVVADAVALGVRVSVDTTQPEVARWALDQGATMINSVSLDRAAELGRLAAEYSADLVLMHSRSMDDMSDFSDYPEDGYDCVVDDVVAEWRAASVQALDAGVARESLWFDPGLGFAKSARHSLQLDRHLSELCDRVAPHPVLVGQSRKSYLAKAVATGAGRDEPTAKQRLGATIAATVCAAMNGANCVRVHDVAEVHQALAYLGAIVNAAKGAVVAPGKDTAERAKASHV